MNLSMSLRAESDQVLFGIVPRLAAKLFVVNLKIVLGAARSASPTFLKIPCLTLRDNTERPISFTIGTNILVGHERRKLASELMKILDGNLKERAISTNGGWPCRVSYCRDTFAGLSKAYDVLSRGIVIKLSIDSFSNAPH